MMTEKITVHTDKIKLIKGVSRQQTTTQRAQVIPNKKHYQRHAKHRPDYRNSDDGRFFL